MFFWGETRTYELRVWTFKKAAPDNHFFFFSAQKNPFSGLLFMRIFFERSKKIDSLVVARKRLPVLVPAPGILPVTPEWLRPPEQVRYFFFN